MGYGEALALEKARFLQMDVRHKEGSVPQDGLLGQEPEGGLPRVRWTSVVALAMAALQLSEHARDALGGRFRAVAGVYSRGPEWEGEGGEACQALALPGLTA